LRQLRLFAGARQRGVRPPPPLEFKLHCMLADTLRLWIMPQFIYTHMPMGEKRDKITAARLKRMGTTKGWPDFLIIGPGRIVWVELKRKGEKPTPEQIFVASHLMACGCTYILTDEYDDAVNQLKRLGIVRAQVSA
jgi:hypothetical protein